jgi:hypothetical protein
MLPAVALASGAGLLAGCLHVLAGPDHVAAVLPLAAQGRGARAGAAWGAGHGLAVAALGGLVLARRGQVDPAPHAYLAERAVGVVLLAVGAWAWWRASRPAPAPARPRAAFGVGLLHGSAGAAHLLGALPALALHPAAAAGWLAGWLLSGVLSMSLVAVGVGALAGRPGWQAPLLRGSGTLALGVGAFWLVAGPA